MSRGKVLITGASGFLGRRTVEMLVEQGFTVRALLRKTSRVGNLGQLGVDVVIGDVADAKSMATAFRGIDCVVHAAADTGGTGERARMATVDGTRNILDLCVLYRIEKLIYISSCSVYSTSDYEDGQSLDENAMTERYPWQRGAYTRNKLAAEQIVLDYMYRNTVPVVCLRPGTIYGPGGRCFSPMMGFSLAEKIFVVVNRHGFFMPLVYVDDMVRAILAAIKKKNCAGQIYNIVDSQQVNKKQYMDGLIRRLYPDARFLYVPYDCILAAVGLQERLSNALGRKPLLTRYSLISSQKAVLYDASKSKTRLNWEPSVSFEQAAGIISAYEKARQKPAHHTADHM